MQRTWWERLLCWLGRHDVRTYFGGRYGVGFVCRRCHTLVRRKFR
jgi:hypothetical protein